MSNAQLWAALQQSAMVGADRLPVAQALGAGVDATAPASRQALQAALFPSADSSLPDSPAAQLLRASALAAVFERAGWQPGAHVALAGAFILPAAAPEEARPAPDDAGLQALMRDALEHGPLDLQASMLRTLGQAGQRLSHDIVAVALEQGRQSVELRHWLAPVLGERGRWLGSLNPQWAYAAGVEETADPELIWQEGSVDQRVALLRGERQDDPARARSRLEASLKELNAKERLPLVQALEVQLSHDDEPLLEKLLTDRSKDVRENAAQLLSCLSDSAHSLRVTGWMRAMLQQDGKGEWIVEPPEEGAKEWERDGIALQPSQFHRGGKKAWLLQQIVELTPLCFWTRTLGKTPMELMEWSKHSDWKTALRQGWLQALRYQLDAQWIDAAELMGRDMRMDTLMPALMAKLSGPEREQRWLTQFERDKGKLIEAIESMAQSVPRTQQLSRDLSVRLVNALHNALGGKQVTGSWNGYQAVHALLACAKIIDVNELPGFAALWRAPAADSPQDAAAAVSEVSSPSIVARTLARFTGFLGKPAQADASGEPAIPLTPEQQDKLERSRMRPWDDENVLAQLERFVNLRLSLHHAYPALQAKA